MEFQVRARSRFRFSCLLEPVALGCSDLMRFVSAENPSGRGSGGSEGRVGHCCAKCVPRSQHKLQYCQGLMGSGGGGGGGAVGGAVGVALVRH